MLSFTHFFERNTISTQPQSNPETGLSSDDFFDWLDVIIKKTINGEGDKDLVSEITKKCNAATKEMKREEIAVFYGKMKEFFSVFFGAEERDESDVTKTIRDLVQKIFPDLFKNKDEKYISGDRVKVLKTRIREEIQKCARLNEDAAYDISDLRKNIFSKNIDATTSLDDLSLNVSLNAVNMPEQVVCALMEIIQGMRKNKVQIIKNKVIERTLKKCMKHTLTKKIDDPRIMQLKNVLSFIESLEREKMRVTDFHIVDYIMDYVDESAAEFLLGASRQTLAGAIIGSKYNGDKLKDDEFILRAKDDMISSVVSNSLSREDFDELILCAIKIAKGELRIQDISLRTGIGASPEKVPLRILSYIVPSLTIAKRFKNAYGESPRVDFFTGQEGGIACNNMSADLVRANTSTIFRIIEDFVQKFFPDIAENFFLVDDKEWSNPETKLMVDYLEYILIEEAKKGNDEHLVRIIEDLERMGKQYGKESGAQHSLKYAAFHVICFRDIPTINEYIDKRQPTQSMIVSFGGRSEKGFDYIRRVITEKFSITGFNEFVTQRGCPELRIENCAKPLTARSSIITDVGSIPPYFLARDAGDIAFEEVSAMTPENMRKLIAERIISALTKVSEGDKNDKRVISGAKSFLQGMALIAAITGRDSLMSFIHNSK